MKTWYCFLFCKSLFSPRSVFAGFVSIFLWSQTEVQKKHSGLRPASPPTETFLCGVNWMWMSCPPTYHNLLLAYTVVFSPFHLKASSPARVSAHGHRVLRPWLVRMLESSAEGQHWKRNMQTLRSWTRNRTACSDKNGPSNTNLFELFKWLFAYQKISQEWAVACTFLAPSSLPCVTVYKYSEVTILFSKHSSCFVGFVSSLWLSCDANSGDYSDRHKVCFFGLPHLSQQLPLPLITWCMHDETFKLPEAPACLPAGKCTILFKSSHGSQLWSIQIELHPGSDWFQLPL